MSGEGVDGPDEPEFDPDQPVAVPIGDALDLHLFAPRDVLVVVEAYLEAAAERGLREVRVIHGKGKGVQRARVQALLGRSAWVESYRDGSAERGGWGATLVVLRSPPGCARE